MPFINIKLLGGPDAPTVEQKAELIKRTTQMMVEVLNKDPEGTVVVIEEVSADNWGRCGMSTTQRRAKK